jgi:hypothetical protein
MSLEPILPSVKSYPKSTDTKWARMESWLLALLTFILSLIIIQSCGLDIEDPTPPSPPVWVQKSLPEEWPERGIDAHESGGIYLEWKSNLEDNIATYSIYRSELLQTEDSLSDYELLVRIAVESMTALEYIDIETSVGIEYYYKLKAEDISNNQSDYSDYESYSLLSPILINEMIPNGITMALNVERQLSWHYTYNIGMEDYCLTVITEKHELVMRQVLSPNIYIGGIETFAIPETITMQNDLIYKWRIDTGANYDHGIESTGSESLWATFIYSGD